MHTVWKVLNPNGQMLRHRPERQLRRDTNEKKEAKARAKKAQREAAKEEKKAQREAAKKE